MWAWFSIYTSYSYIEASNEEYQEEEGYTQEEEENFDSYPHQGKLTLANHHDAKLHKSKAPSSFNFMFYLSHVFTLQLFLLSISKYLLIYDSLGSRVEQYWRLA